MARNLLVAIITGLVLIVALGAAADAQVGQPAGGLSTPHTLALNAAGSPVLPTFTYQGQLRNSRGPITGTCEVRFRLFDAETGGTALTAPLTETVAMSNGLFGVQLPWGHLFTGDARWLEVGVRCGAEQAISVLRPRQPLTPAPYALGLRPGARVVGSQPHGNVLYAENTDAADAFSYGVRGVSNSPGRGKGVSGEATGPGAVGVFGTAVITGAGVYGSVAVGQNSVEGLPALGGYGGYFLNRHAGDRPVGVSARAPDPAGVAVEGYSYTGASSDVHPAGSSAGPAAGEFAGKNGIIGAANAAGGAGVTGIAQNGRGVFGWDRAPSGSDSVGVYGQSDSPDGWAGRFQSSSGNGVYVSTPAGKAGLIVAGGSKTAVVATEDGSRLMYSEESTEVWFSDYGFGRLKDGVAAVPLDPVFAQTVDLGIPYHVFLQAYADAELYVAGRTPVGFEVRLRSGDKAAEFSYRVVAIRLGQAGNRLARAPWADGDPNLASGMQPGGQPPIGGRP